MRDYTKSLKRWLHREIRCECGRTHRVELDRVEIGPGALAQVPEEVLRRSWRRVAIVGDANTLAAAGHRLAGLLGGAGIAVQLCRIEANERGEVLADEQAIVQLLVELEPATDALIAAGSGTLHDIVRFAAHRTGRPFLSVPTAPSVDGFASTGAPLLLRGFKRTIPASSPAAIFADTDVLAAAPQPMVAAGFGDLLGKYTSLADWKLGRLLQDEAYCPLAAQITAEGLELCVRHVDEIARRTAHGVGLLMEGLILSGISMLMVGNSRPASGAEHHLSHFWEMRGIREGKPAFLHGAKVGTASVMIAGHYREIAAMPAEEAAARIRAWNPPDPDAEIAQIREAYGPIAPEVVRENFPQPGEPAGTGSDAAEAFRERVISRWRDIREIAAGVPAPGQLADWLRQTGGPASPEELGLGLEWVTQSLKSAFYVRSRYTVLRLQRSLSSKNS